LRRRAALPKAHAAFPAPTPRLPCLAPPARAPHFPPPHRGQPHRGRPRRFDADARHLHLRHRLFEARLRLCFRRRGRAAAAPGPLCPAAASHAPRPAGGRMSPTGHSPARRLLLVAGHRLLILAFLAFAMLPLYWLVKISLTPERLLYSEGVALWPSRMTLDNFVFVLLKSSFPTFFRNSIVVSLGTAAIVTVIAAGAGYAFSRFRFRGRYAVMFVLLL